MNTAQTLKDYLTALQNRGLSAALNSAASPEEIKNFESEHGIRLPDLFNQIYQSFNGQMNELIPPSEPRWLGLEEIFSKQQDWKDFCQTHYGKHWENLTLKPFDGEGFVKNTLFHPFWLPFMADEGGFYCLDYDPDKNGQVSQVIYANLHTDINKTNIVHLANNFTQWFENHVQAFQSRRLAVTLNTLLEEYFILQKANPMLSLNSPAETQNILMKEAFLLVEFPRALVKIWLEFNGYQEADPMGGDYWIPVEKIELIQQQWKEQLTQRLGTDPEKTMRPDADQLPNVQPYYYHPLWIPVYQNQTVLVVLDYSPTEEGVYGQPLIIYNQFEYSISSEVDTFDEWLYRFLSYYLYPEDELGEMIDSEIFSLEITNHYQYYLGIPNDGFNISGYPHELHLLWFKRTPVPNTSILVSCGNSQKIFQDSQGDYCGIEFMMFLPQKKEKNYSMDFSPSQKWALNILAIASQALQSNLFKKALDEDCLIPNGEPMQPLEGTNFSGFAIINRHFFLPEVFYQFKNTQQEKVKTLLVIPLYKEEIEFILQNDIEDFINYIEKNDITLLADIERERIIFHQE